MLYSKSLLFGGDGLVTKSCPTLATPWTVARQASLSMGLSRQEYWSGLPCPPPGDLPDPRTEPASPALQADSCIGGGFFTDSYQGSKNIFRDNSLQWKKDFCW